MRVVRQTELGGPEVLELVDVARPEPGPTEILVRVHAAGVNPVDWKTREHGVFLGQPPFVLGWDVSGTVEQVGFGVSWLQPGDEVLGMPAFPKEVGGYGEFVVAPSRHFVRKPAGLSHVEAAALPLAGLTAWQALIDDADVRPGQKVLVHAAAGGVGLLLVQLAKSRGGKVIGTVSTAEKEELARGAGADEVIRYTETDFAAAVHDLTGGVGVAAVYDGVGRDTFDKSMACLARRGVLALFGASSGPVPPVDPQRLNAGGSLFLTRPTLAHHLATPEEFQWRCDELFSGVASVDSHLVVSP